MKTDQDAWDLFAAGALNGFSTYHPENRERFSDIAKDAALVADFMMDERAKRIAAAPNDELARVKSLIVELNDIMPRLSISVPPGLVSQFDVLVTSLRKVKLKGGAG